MISVVLSMVLLTVANLCDMWFLSNSKIRLAETNDKEEKEILETYIKSLKQRFFLKPFTKALIELIFICKLYNVFIGVGLCFFDIIVLVISYFRFYRKN